MHVNAAVFKFCTEWGLSYKQTIPTSDFSVFAFKSHLKLFLENNKSVRNLNHQMLGARQVQTKLGHLNDMQLANIAAICERCLEINKNTLTTIHTSSLHNLMILSRGLISHPEPGGYLAVLPPEISMSFFTGNNLLMLLKLQKNPPESILNLIKIKVQSECHSMEELGIKTAKKAVTFCQMMKSNLRRLNLTKVSGITDEILSQIGDYCTEIVHLDIPEEATLTNSGLSKFVQKQENLRRLFCSGRFITQLPPEVVKFTQLGIFCPVEKLPDSFPHLEVFFISLQGNSTSIPKKIPVLKHLKVQGPENNIIPLSLPDALPNLEILECSNIRFIHKFPELPELKTLDCRNCHHLNIKSLEKLEKLFMRNVTCNSFPKSFPNLEIFSSISSWVNVLEHLTSQAFPSLRILSIGNFNNFNRIKIGNLTHLNELSLKDCKGVAFSGNLPQLKILSLVNCNLSSSISEGRRQILSDKIVPALESLSITGTYGSCFNASQFQISNLKKLTLHNVFSKGLSKYFPKLEFLDIRQTFMNDHVSTFDNLKVLKLSYQNINFIDELPYLEELHLHESQITIAHVKLPNLKIIKTTGLSLRALQKMQFDSIESYYISWSYLSEFPENFKYAKSIEFDHIHSLYVIPKDLPNLENLSVKGCRDLYTIPKELISQLKTLSVTDCPNLSDATLQAIKEWQN